MLKCRSHLSVEKTYHLVVKWRISPEVCGVWDEVWGVRVGGLSQPG